MTLYLLCNVLLFAGFPLAQVWPLPNAARLRLTRVMLLCCLAGPVVFHWLPPPRSVPQLGIGSVMADAVGETFARAPANGAARLAVSTRPALDARRVFLALVLAGAAVGLGRLGRDAYSIRRTLRRAIPFRRHGQVRVLISGETEVPFSFRELTKKYIVLPVALLDRPFELRMAVSHEAQHHRQGDCLLAYPQELLRLVFFLNPMVHAWLRKLGELQELSCDEALVVRRRYSPREYGECLVRVARRAAHTGMAGVIGMATRPLLQRRIAMLFTYQRPVSRRLWLSAIAFLGSLLPTLGVAYALDGEPRPGRVDRSHVDGRIQQIAEEEVRAALSRSKARSAAVVVLDSRTGAVLAFAEAGAAGWETRAIPPGSVVKPFLYDAAIKAGLVTPETILDCRGPVALGGHALRDYKPFELLSVREALARSSNIGAFRISQRLGLSGVKNVLETYGLSGESLAPGEGDEARLANLADGQSVSTTIAALARAYGTLATQGSDAIREMLTYAVTNGTGTRASIPGLSVAGKTGTVGLVEDAVLASFAGFVPANAPRYVIYAIVENAKDASATGGALAAPLFQRVAARGMGK